LAGRIGRGRVACVSVPSEHWGSLSSVDRGVDPSDVVEVGQPVGVFQVKQGVQRPVQVVGEVRDLFMEAVGRVRDYSPRRLPDKSMVNS
jgi:hypothetical protein